MIKNHAHAHLTVCDVCRLIDGDTRPKWCSWCETCKAWLCQDDVNQMGRRALAMARRALAQQYN